MVPVDLKTEPLIPGKINYFLFFPAGTSESPLLPFKKRRKLPKIVQAKQEVDFFLSQVSWTIIL